MPIEILDQEIFFGKNVCDTQEEKVTQKEKKKVMKMEFVDSILNINNPAKILDNSTIGKRNMNQTML